MTAADDQRTARVAEAAILAAHEGAHVMFQLYTAYITAGFTADQAMAVVLTVIKTDVEAVR